MRTAWGWGPACACRPSQPCGTASRPATRTRNLSTPCWFIVLKKTLLSIMMRCLPYKKMEKYLPSKHTGKGHQKWPKFTNNPSSIPVRSTSRIPKVLISCRPVPGVCGVGAASALAPARILILYCLYNLCMSYQSYFKGLKIKMLEVIYRKFKFDEDWWASIHVSPLCVRTALTEQNNYKHTETNLF